MGVVQSTIVLSELALYIFVMFWKRCQNFKSSRQMKQLIRRPTLIAIALLGMCNAALAQAHNDSNPIQSVLLVKQLSCNGFVAHEYTRSPDAAEIISKGTIQIPNLQLEFSIPRIPELPVTSIRLAFDDRGRKVVDHYVLLSVSDLVDPSAAVMVTELPPSFDTAQKALGAAVAAERSNMQGTAARPTFERIATAWGEGLDLFVPNRIGSPCFPAARYRLATEGKPTIGLSRFISVPGRLIQFAVSVEVAPESSIEMQMAHARRVMDVFASGLRTPLARLSPNARKLEDAAASEQAVFRKSAPQIAKTDKSIVQPLASVVPEKSQLRLANPPTNFADINSIDAVPNLSSECRQKYRTWLTWPIPRGFAVNPNGHCGYTTGTKPSQRELPADPVERALAVCEKKFGACALYAIDDAVVWKH